MMMGLNWTQGGHLSPGMFLFWDREGPNGSNGHDMDYGMGSMDGGYKARLHIVVPCINRKTLTNRQKEYNDVHGFYRTCVEHLLARTWHWGIIRNVMLKCLELGCLGWRNFKFVWKGFV